MEKGDKEGDGVNDGDVATEVDGVKEGEEEELEINRHPKACKVEYSKFMRNLTMLNLITDNVIYDNGTSIPTQLNYDTNKNVTSDTEVDTPRWTTESFDKVKRRINIDITPKLCLSDGEMVNLLRNSNCSRYMEFKAVNRSLIHHEDELITAPCNREQIFNSKKLKVIEKRLMMKFITFAYQLDIEGEEFNKLSGKTAAELFRSQKLTQNLVDLIQSSLLMSTKLELSAQDVILSVQKYIRSVNVFGSIPYIFPIYGSGELPQSFARFSAVFGTVFVLDMPLDKLLFEGDVFSGIKLSTGQEIIAKHCIMSPNYRFNDMFHTMNRKNISNAVVLTTGSLKPTVKEDDRNDVTTVFILPGKVKNSCPILGYEFGPGSFLPAEDMYMVHLQTEGESPQSDLQPIIDSIIPDSVRCLYKIFFTTTMCSGIIRGEILMPVNNVIRTSCPVFSTGYEDAICEARDIFLSLFPGEEFMMSAPNPEDIKWEDDDVKNLDDVKQIESVSSLPNSSSEQPEGFNRNENGDGLNNVSCESESNDSIDKHVVNTLVEPSEELSSNLGG